MVATKRQNTWIYGALAALAYFLLYGWRLWYPTEMYFDEVYHVKAAREILALNGYSETSHPPFGKILIAVSIWIFGDHSWAWRVPSLVCGFGCLVLIYQITSRLTKNAMAGFLAAFLFSIDQVSFTQSRIGMLNAPMFFFMLLGVWALLKCTEREWPLLKMFWVSGVALGLGLATRLVALSIGALYLFFWIKLWRQGEDKKTLLLGPLFFWAVLPAAIYLLAYGYVPFVQGMNWQSIGMLQKLMLSYHLHLKETHTYQSEWWTWPLMLRPIWFQFQSQTESTQGILAVGNPVIYWTAPLALTWGFWRLFRERSAFFAFALLGYFTQWLQWAPVSRITFFHYIYTAMPFAAMLQAAWLAWLWKTGTPGKIAAGTLVALAAIFFIYWLPYLNGLPVSWKIYQNHVWFRAWV